MTPKTIWHVRRLRRIIDAAALRVVTRTGRVAKVKLVAEVLTEKELHDLIVSAYRVTEEVV